MKAGVGDRSHDAKSVNIVRPRVNRLAHWLYSLLAVADHPKAIPVAIASNNSISPTIVAALPSMRIRFTPSAISRKPALHASSAFCAFVRSIPVIMVYLGVDNPRG